MKKPFSDKRWNDKPLGKIIGQSDLSKEELKKRTDIIKKEINDKKKKNTK